MSAEPISIEIGGVQHGWANANVRVGNSNYQMDGFSYTTNAFDDLTRFGVEIALDTYNAEITFDGEPAGWIWEFEQKFDPHGFHSVFRIFEVASLYDADSPRSEIFSATVERDQLALALLEAISRLEREMTLEGF